MYPTSDIVDAVEAGLAKEADRLEEAQSVRGLDALDELSLHPILATALERAGYGVSPEERYPAGRGKASQSEGERCDLVLTPDGRPLAAPEQDPTLFDPPDAVALDDAFWLEVKVIAQFTTEGANRSYASALLSAARQDVTKLSRDPDIAHAGLLIVLFALDEQVTEHDLDAWESRCLEAGLPIGSPARSRFSIADRLGNRLCAVVVYPVYGEGERD
ncbi:MAG: hypothetical protein ACYS0G_16025 [Planctomycetota bacterium]|jgi:hypothetical protein